MKKVKCRNCNDTGWVSGTLETVVPILCDCAKEICPVCGECDGGAYKTDEGTIICESCGYDEDNL